MQRHIKALIDAAADRAGYRIIPKWRLNSYQLADHLASLFSVRQIDTVFDVGANRGQYHRFLRDDVGFKGRIWSFEPVPELARDLEKRAKTEANWRIFNTALGATKATLSLNVTQSSDLSSFLTPTTKHTAELTDTNAVVRQEEVPVITLDSVFAEHANDLASANIYLKLDTQGFDLEVLKGGQTSLPQIVALQTELSITPIYESMPSYLDVLRYLDSRNFSPSIFSPVDETRPYKVLEIDCCMVNNLLKSRAII